MLLILQGAQLASQVQSSRGMDANLLAMLKARYGTVSGLTQTSGTVAVRNKTALRELTAMLEGRATVTPKTTGFPQLVVVTEVSQ